MSASRLAAQDIQPAYATLSGRVTDQVTGQPVPVVTVSLEGTGLITLTDSAGMYHLVRVPPGPQVIRAEALGYATMRIPLTVAPQGAQVRDITLAPSALQVEGISVTADPTGRARGELGTATVIGREAVEHQVAASLKGILEFVPGEPLSPPGLGTVQQISLRTVPTSTGGEVGAPSASDIASFGTVIILDGVPLSNNANLQTTGPRGELRPPASAGGGMDLRRIPASTIERVEVIRGLPSARYGDLTHGAVVVDTRAGAVDPAFAFRYDARTTEASVVGGSAFGDRQTGTLTLDLARTLKAPGLRDDDVWRLDAQLAHRLRAGGESGQANGDSRFVLDSRLHFFQLYEDNPEQPDVRPGRASWSRDLGFRVSERARLSLAGGTQLEFSGSLDNTRQRSYVQSLATRGAMPFTDRLTEGRSEGHFIGGPYIAALELEGDPWLLYGRIEGRRPITLFGYRNRLVGGLELRREWNDGPGYIFEIEFPPQVRFNGVQGFDRPRRFDQIPPVATSAFYIDDRAVGLLPGSILLDLQVGLRLDLLHSGSWWLSSLRDAALQPRLNLQLAPWRWLRLRGAFGKAAKQPSIASLYPPPQYYDVVNVNWFADDPAERLAVLSTFIRDPTNADLGFSLATKAEAGLEFGLGDASAVSLVVFNDEVSGAVGLENLPGWIPRDHFELADTTAGTGRPPRVIEPPAYTDTVPITVDRPANNTSMESRGAELTASLPEIPFVRTRLELQGAWVETEIRKDGIDFGPFGRFGEFQLDENKPRTPFWESPTRYGERAILTYRGIHHQPQLGLVISATVQHTLRLDQYDVGGTDTLAFAGYMTRDGRLVRVPPEERGQPQYQDLRVPRAGILTRPNPAPADWFLSLQVSKTLPLGGRLSFYAFNAFDRQGKYAQAGVGGLLFPAMRFGLELVMPARAVSRLFR